MIRLSTCDYVGGASIIGLFGATYVMPRPTEVRILQETAAG